MHFMCSYLPQIVSRKPTMARSRANTIEPDVTDIMRDEHSDDGTSILHASFACPATSVDDVPKIVPDNAGPLPVEKKEIKGDNSRDIGNGEPSSYQ